MLDTVADTSTGTNIHHLSKSRARQPLSQHFQSSFQKLLACSIKCFTYFSSLRKESSTRVKTVAFLVPFFFRREKHVTASRHANRSQGEKDEIVLETIFQFFTLTFDIPIKTSCAEMSESFTWKIVKHCAVQ